MPRPSSAAALAEECRRCGGKFGVDIDPCDKNEKEILKRRFPRALVCAPCFNFCQGIEKYSELRDDALMDLLKDPEQKALFMDRRAAWCAERKAH